MTTDTRLQVLSLRTAADIIEGCATEASEITLAGLLADPSWFDEVLFGTLDNLDHPEGVDLFDRETYATIRREVLALIARADYGPCPVDWSTPGAEAAVLVPCMAVVGRGSSDPWTGGHVARGAHLLPD